MKKFLGLVLLFILVGGISLVFLMSRSNVGSGNWDLTSPANNSYIASFPALVRANQTAIVASLTPPIEWTADGNIDYGTASVKLGYEIGSGIPAYWIGSIGSAAMYIFGARNDIPMTLDGWFVAIASSTSDGNYMTMAMPKFDGSGQAGSLRIVEDEIDLGNRKIKDIATGTSDTYAVNVGQMGASLSYALNNLATGTDNTDAVNVGQLYETIGRGYDVYAWRELLTIPADGIATFVEILDNNNSFDNATFTAPQQGWYEFEIGGSMDAGGMATSSIRIEIDLYEDSNFNPLELYSSLLSVSIENSYPNTIKSFFAKRIMWLNQYETVVLRWLGGNPSVVGIGIQYTIRRMRKSGEIY